MIMSKKNINKIFEKTIKSLNEGRPSEKMITLDFSSKLTGENSILDSIDLIMFIVEFESQLKAENIFIDLMKLIEGSLINNKEITLTELIHQL